MHLQEKVTSNCTPSASTRRVELERYEAQLAEWTVLIGQYRASARRAGTQARGELDSITDELQLRRNEAGAHIMRLKAATAAEWEHERGQVERAWQAVRSSFQKAKAWF